MLGEVNVNSEISNGTVKTNTNQLPPNSEYLVVGLEQKVNTARKKIEKRKENKATFLGDSLKAVVSVPGTVNKLKQQPVEDTAKPNDQKRRQILLDLLNLERLEHTIKIADSVGRLEMSNNNNNNNNNNNHHTRHPVTQIRSSTNRGNLKNSASLAEINRANEKKIVRQVLKDLIWLYKSESSVNVPSVAPAKVAPTPVATTTAAPPKKPVEIKIRKDNDKLIIKSSEPIIINTSSSSDELEGKKSEPSVKQPAETNIISTEHAKLVQPRGDLANSIKSQANALDLNDKAKVNFVRRVKYLGIVDTDPEEYRRKYGGELKQASELPEIIKNLKTPHNLRLAADKSSNSIYELVGDLEALKYVDLDSEGLSQYRDYLIKIGILDANSKETAVGHKEPDSLLKIVKEIFKTMDSDQDGFVSIHDAEKILLKLNSRCGRNYGEDDLKEFFRRLDTNKDNLLDFEEFKKAFFTVKC